MGAFFPFGVQTDGAIGGTTFSYDTSTSCPQLNGYVSSTVLHSFAKVIDVIRGIVARQHDMKRTIA